MFGFQLTVIGFSKYLFVYFVCVSVDKLRKASQKLGQSGGSIEITLEHSHESLRLPRKAIRLLSTIISNMAAGKSMAIILSDTTVGTQEAADYLEVSAHNPTETSLDIKKETTF